MTPSQPSPTNLSDELREKVDGILNSYWVDMLVAPSEKKQIVRDKAIAAITTAYAEAIRSAVPEWADKAYYTKHPVIWKPVAPESNAEHYDAGFNQAIDTFTANLQSSGLLPTNASDEGSAAE